MDNKNKNTWKSFIVKVLLLLPIPLFVLIVNYQSDPASIYGSAELEIQLAELISENKNVSLTANYNERAFQKEYIKIIREKPDIVVLGSSRSMQVSSDNFPGLSLFNNCVPNAVIQDYLAITQMYYDKGIIPETIIIGVDPWVLIDDNKITRWREYKQEYMKAHFRITGKKPFSLSNISPIKQQDLMLLSPAYFQRSIRKLVKDPGSIAYFHEAESLDSHDQIKMADGSLLLDAAERQRTEAEVLWGAQRYVFDYRMAKFTEPSRKLTSLLSDFISSLQKDNVDVIIFLPPFHPVTYDMMLGSANFLVVSEVEKVIRDMAEEKKVKIIGSYDPENCLLDGADFYDHYHPKREAVAGIFQSLTD